MLVICLQIYESFRIVVQKSANFFIKKLCFLRFNKLYVLIWLDLAQ